MDCVSGVVTLAGAAVEVVFRAEGFPMGVLDVEGVEGGEGCGGGIYDEDLRGDEECWNVPSVVGDPNCESAIGVA